MIFRLPKTTKVLGEISKQDYRTAFFAIRIKKAEDYLGNNLRPGLE